MYSLLLQTELQAQINCIDFTLFYYYCFGICRFIQCCSAHHSNYIFTNFFSFWSIIYEPRYIWWLNYFMLPRIALKKSSSVEAACDKRQHNPIRHQLAKSQPSRPPSWHSNLKWPVHIYLVDVHWWSNIDNTMLFCLHKCYIQPNPVSSASTIAALESTVDRCTQFAIRRR